MRFSSSSKTNPPSSNLQSNLVYKLPQKRRGEIEAMVGLSDLKETKVYKEAVQEGEEKKTAKIIPRLVAMGLTVEQIAAAVELNVDQVQQLIQEQAAD